MNTTKKTSTFYLPLLLCAFVVLFATGCKKDAFNEKDALAAQTDFLKMKQEHEIKLEQLKQSGATALSQLQHSFAVAIIRLNDSITRANSQNNDSIGRVNTRKRDIIITVTDVVTQQPVAGADVSIPTLVNTLLTVKTNAQGIATFAAAGNINVPNPASAIVTKEGYGSGSAIAAIGGSGFTAGTRSIAIWHMASVANVNTIKGNVTIQTNFVNPTVAEVAPGKLINVFATVNINGRNQRFDWSTLTDAKGNYSIPVPDLPAGGLFFLSHRTFDSTAKLAINGFAPGISTVPHIENIEASYYLGTRSTGTTLPLQAQGVTAFVPPSVPRYHAQTPADSNGHIFYFRNITFTTHTVNSGNEIRAFVSPNFARASANHYDAAGLQTDGAFTLSPRFKGTTNAALDSMSATFVDVLDNADGLWTRKPVLQLFITGTDRTITPIVHSISSGSATTNSFSLINKRKGGEPTTNYYDPAAWGRVNSSLFNSLNNAVQNRSLNIQSSIIPTTFNASATAFIITINISGGQTIVQDLSFGTGQLKKGVR